MKATLVYGLIVETDDLHAAAVMDRMLQKPSLAMQLIIKRRTIGTLESNAPGRASLASLPVEVLSQILVELSNSIRSLVSGEPALFCKCCAEQHYEDEELFCDECRPRYRDGYCSECESECECGGPGEVKPRMECHACAEIRTGSHKRCGGCFASSSDRKYRTVSIIARFWGCLSFRMQDAWSDVDHLLERYGLIRAMHCTQDHHDFQVVGVAFKRSTRHVEKQAKATAPKKDHVAKTEQRTIKYTHTKVSAVEESMVTTSVRQEDDFQSITIHPTAFVSFSQRFAVKFIAFAKAHDLRHVAEHSQTIATSGMSDSQAEEGLEELHAKPYMPRWLLCAHEPTPFY
jgi:hypothetical protein